MPAITRINLRFSLRTLRNAFSSDVNSVHTRVGGCTRGKPENLNFCKAEAKKNEKKMKKSRMREPKRRQGVMPIRALGLSASLARIEGDT